MAFGSKKVAKKKVVKKVKVDAAIGGSEVKGKGRPPTEDERRAGIQAQMRKTEIAGTVRKAALKAGP